MGTVALVLAALAIWASAPTVWRWLKPRLVEGQKSLIQVFQYLGSSDARAEIKARVDVWTSLLEANEIQGIDKLTTCSRCSKIPRDGKYYGILDQIVGDHALYLLVCARCWKKNHR